MKFATFVLVAVAAVAALLCWRTRAAPLSEAQFIVQSNKDAITVTAPNGEKQSVLWKDLTKVAIRTTDDGPWQADVFWGFHTGNDKPTLVFPGGATGEQELLKEMESRLHGFDDQAVIKAMGSTSNAYFIVWQRGK